MLIVHLISVIVAVFGESAGSASISLHMISNQSKDLFHKAILMSGNLYSQWAMTSVNWTQRIAEKLGWDGDGGDKAVLHILQRASADAITKATADSVTDEDRKHYIFFPFTPVIESYESTQCFLNEDPKEAINSSWGKNIPVIIGYCSDEGLLAYKRN